MPFDDQSNNQPILKNACFSALHLGGLYPRLTQGLGLLQHQFDSAFLQVGRVFVFAQDAFNHQAQLGPDALAL